MSETTMISGSIPDEVMADKQGIEESQPSNLLKIYRKAKLNFPSYIHYIRGGVKEFWEHLTSPTMAIGWVMFCIQTLVLIFTVNTPAMWDVFKGGEKTTIITFFGPALVVTTIMVVAGMATAGISKGQLKILDIVSAGLFCFTALTVREGFIGTFVTDNMPGMDLKIFWIKTVALASLAAGIGFMGTQWTVTEEKRRPLKVTAAIISVTVAATVQWLLFRGFLSF